MEEITAIEPIYTGRILDLAVHTVRLPDGSESRREIITHHGAVAVVAVDANQHILLVRQFRSAARRPMVEIPAGLLEPGEDPLACAIRELREEIGQRPLHIEALGGMHVAPGYTTEYIHLFLAHGLEPDPLPQDADEFIEVLQLPLADALARIENGEITDSKTLIGLLRAARRLGL